MMNCSASIFSTATSARTSPGTAQVGVDSGRSGPGPATVRVAAMAAMANRPTSSLVSRFSATDAASVPSNLPTPATTVHAGQPLGRGDQVVMGGTVRRTIASPRAASDVGRVVVGEHPHVDPPGHHAVLDVVHRVGDVVGPVHHLGLQARPGRGRAVAHPVGGSQVVGVEAELAPAAAGAPTDTS